jgi:hypothetical protein
MITSYITNFGFRYHCYFDITNISFVIEIQFICNL